KMSKSKGNATKPAQIIQSYGADILRWWVASVDAKDDVQLSPQLLDQAKQSFLKIRNTLRFLLGNLNEFSGVCVPVDTLTPMDRWIVHQAQTVHDAVVSEYNALAIHRAVQRIGQFCSGDLSAHYLDSVKDRLYCDAPQSHSRQCAQSTLVYLFELFIRMIAPILVFTAEDAYQHYALKTMPSVHSLTVFEPGTHSTELAQAEAKQTWPAVFAIKEQVYQAAEALRQTKVIKQFLQTQVTITLPSRLAHLASFSEWRTVLLVAEVTCCVDTNSTDVAVQVTPVDYKKCDRCWRYDPTVSDTVCARCEQVVEVVQ
ncbi:MAG: class I tRNA ligase family protein, partial [Candidatus Marinamargulisbacteria bacterium]|nr:class I tRNA ligase family protein [Candidatus Marinamargulisbacteria bacterium]